jgi:hypothetical protein
MKNNISSLALLKQVMPVLVLVAGLTFAQGCADYQLRMPNDDPVNKPYEGGAMHAYAWGWWYNPQVMTANCASQAINDVVVKRTYLHDLASVFTFGVWMPVEITYRCKAPEGVIKTFPSPPETPR